MTSPGARTARLIRRTVAAVAGLIVGLILAEAVVRSVLPEVGDTVVVPIREIDCKYHHPPVPLESLERPRAGAYRILFLGDSFTYGETERDQTFPHLVGEYFRAGAVDNLPPIDVQTFNLGMLSYSPSIEGVVLRDYAPQLRPHLVVIAVDDSDPQDDLGYRQTLRRDENGLPVSVYPDLLPGNPARVSPWVSSLYEKSKLVRVSLWAWWKYLRDPVERSQPLTEYEDRLRTAEVRFSHYLPEGVEEWRPYFEHTLDLVDAMVEYCRGRGIEVAIVNYPYPPAVSLDILADWRKRYGVETDRVCEPSFHAFQREYANRKGVPYYDFTPYLRNLPDIEDLYNPGAHFWPVGNQHFARELVRFLYPIVRES